MTLEMPLINCGINSIRNFSGNCIILTFTGPAKFAITDTKLYVSVVILSTSKTGFEKRANWNKFSSHVEEKTIFESFD